MTKKAFVLLPVSLLTSRDSVVRVEVSPLFLTIYHKVSGLEGNRVLRVHKRIAASLLASEIELSNCVRGYCGRQVG